MDGCNNDIPEYVAKIHKSVSMKQPHWDHDGFKQEETKPCRMSEGHAKCVARLRGSGESRSERSFSAYIIFALCASASFICCRGRN